MRVLVAGGDGFCGWATALHLSECGHEVALLDNLSRRHWDEELGIESLTPIATPRERAQAWKRLTGAELALELVDLTDIEPLSRVLQRHRPEAIVHFGEHSSAPYSMIDARHATTTQVNNVVGTLNLLFCIRDLLPGCHLIKLGTMGEYGTPNIDIEEGYLCVEHNGRKDRLPYPKQPGSFYHLSKVHDSNNILFACRAWGLRATDLNQGIVYNTQTPETCRDPALVNRFDYDSVFGTVLNRFCVQAALGMPITVYGAGGQTRGFIDLRDTVRCVQIALDSPPSPGRLRVMNQFTEQWSVMQLAQRVCEIANRSFDLEAAIEQVENQRVERETHYYKAAHSTLLKLGLQPHLLCEETIASMLQTAIEHADRADPQTIAPWIDWRQGALRALPATRNGKVRRPLEGNGQPAKPPGNGRVSTGKGKPQRGHGNNGNGRSTEPPALVGVSAEAWTDQLPAGAVAG